MSLTLAGPRFFSFAKVGLGMICSAGAVASVESDVPTGTAGLIYDSRHAINVADGILPKFILFVGESSAGI